MLTQQRTIFVNHGTTPLYNRYDTPIDTPVQIQPEYVNGTPEDNVTVVNQTVGPFRPEEGIVPRNLTDEFVTMVVKRKYDYDSSNDDDDDNTELDNYVNETELDDDMTEDENADSDDSHESDVIDLKSGSVMLTQKRSGQQWEHRLKIRRAQQKIEKQLEKEFRQRLKEEQEEEEREQQEFLKTFMGQQNAEIVRHYMRNPELLGFKF